MRIRIFAFRGMWMTALYGALLVGCGGETRVDGENSAPSTSGQELGAVASRRVDLLTIAARERVAPAAAPRTVAERVGLAEAELKPVRSQVYANGTKVVRHQQYYQGVPVMDGFAVEHLAPGAARSTLSSGEVLLDIARDLPSARPQLSEANALLRAKFAVQQYVVENEQATLYVRAGEDDRPRLVYLVSFFVPDASNPSRPFFLMDANTGAILERWEGLETASASGPGGNTKTGQYEYGVSRPALEVTTDCKMFTGSVTTVDLQGGVTSDNMPFQFTCPRNTHKSVNGAYAPINDVHFNAVATRKMYMDYFGIPPVASMIARAHMGGAYVQNATWDGKTANFGDGGDILYPLVSLDVVAHEFSHGFTQANSGLIGKWQMAGGMNEAFSDMAGEAAEYHTRGQNDFRVGAEIMKSASAIRYMNNPPLDGGSLDNAYYFQSNVTEQHHSSGIYNKAFYLLATSPNWNTRKAFEVMVDANRFYWKSEGSFDQGACGVESAASVRGYRVADVTAAFNTVGVNCGKYKPVVQQLYFAHFGRPADTGGLANFSSALQAQNATDFATGLEVEYGFNPNIKALIDSLGNSAESQALHSGGTSAFINAVFTYVRNRPPTSTELASWKDKIDNQGMTRGLASLSILRTTLESTNAADKVTIRAKTAMAQYFTAALDTPTEVSAYSGTRAAATARNMLSQVSDTTDVNAFQSTVNATIADIVAGR